MTNKNIIFAVAAVIIVVGAGAYLVTQMNSENKVEEVTTSDSTTQGKVIFGITDAAADLNGVSSIMFTVNKAEIHSSASGWTAISTATNQYDLLALKQSGKVELLANANVAAGSYDQMRLMVSKVVVVKDGASQEAKLPSGELKINGNITVAADKTTTVVFDVIADKSLHATGNGKFIFAPVVKVQKQNGATVEFKSNNEISIMGGSKEGDTDFGMDEKGEVKSNFELKGNLNVDVNNVIQLGGDVKVETDNKLTFNLTAQSDSGVSGTVKLSEKDGKTTVAINIKSNVLNLLAPGNPAHVHLGSCANIGAVKYPLNTLVNGMSETTISTSLAGLKAQLPLAINVHKSAAQSNVYIACTDLSL